MFRTTSDTEVLLALYARYREAMLPKLRGMFAFAIWQRDLRELFLARDAYGIDGLNTWFASTSSFALAPPDVERSTREVAAMLEMYEMNFKAITCSECDSVNVRRSALRKADIMQLISLKYPVRCRKCLERRYIGIFKALRLEPSRGSRTVRPVH